MLGRLFRNRKILTNEQRIEELRRRGVKIGNTCIINSMQFSTEPYLIELGDNVAIAHGVIFITHDGLAVTIRHEHPGIQVFGRIRIGSGTAVGMNSMLLPGVDIGKGCIVGAGSVVRGVIPDNSLVVGNPAKIVGRASLVWAKMTTSPHRLDLYDASPEDRRRKIEEHFHLR